ncbi:MAG: AbrB/MazE/SpoVT family DNA-binding domain-containing protein [Nanoarchaeota archaeon]|nr:AbrB/MazE/SpoVT family DNA-binding domain-containing protein [Nanoarchaeota archaeon]
MKRKIIKQGHNTLTITLPSKWVKKLNLTSKDEVDIIEKDNSLLINSQENFKEKTTTIDITDFTIPLLWRYFQSAYRSGCDEIKVIFDSKKDYDDAFHYYTTSFEYNKLGEKVPSKTALPLIQSVVERFLNIAIIRSGKNYCIIKEMGDPSMKEFDNSLRRIFIIIQQLFDRTIEAIKEDEIGNTIICKEFHTIDLNIDKFVDYCCRIMKKIETSFPDGKKRLLFSTLFLLELIGDEFKYVGKHLALTKKSVKDTIPLIEKIKEHFNIYYKLFYKFDRESSINFGKNDLEIYSKHFIEKKKLKGESKSIANHFMAISKFTLALAELRIEMEFD